MNIIFWGTPDYSVESLKILINSHHKISAVITQPDKKRSRGSKLIPSPIKKIALDHDIPVFTPDKIKNNVSFVETLKFFKSDIFVVISGQNEKSLSSNFIDLNKSLLNNL
mgnify:CR=1 FL=1